MSATSTTGTAPRYTDSDERRIDATPTMLRYDPVLGGTMDYGTSSGAA